MIRYFRKDRNHYIDLLEQGDRVLTPEERDQIIEYISGSGKVEMKPLMDALSRTYLIKNREVRQDKISLVEEILFIRKPKGVCGQLVRVLRGPVEPVTRGFIFGMLSTLVNEDEVDSIVSLLQSKESEYRRSGQEILKRMRPAAVTRSILKNLDDQAWYTKADALHLLHETDRGAAVAAARSILKGSTEFERKQAILVLAEIGTREAVAVLDENAGDESPRIRTLIAESLVKIGSAETLPALVKLLADEKREVVTAAMQGLGVIQDRRVAPAIAALLESSSDVRVQLGAIEALGRIGTENEVMALVQRIKDENLQIRQAAAKSLSEIAMAEGTDLSRLLIELMSDRDVNVRRCVAGILGSVRDPMVFERMFEFLRDEDWWVREAIADSLANLGDPRVVEPAMRLLEDQSEILRRYGIEILTGIKDIRAVDPFIRMLRDPDWWVRERAIEGLGRLGDTRVVPLLIRMLRVTEFAYVCARALGELGDGRAVRPLARLLRQGSSEVKLAILESLARLDARAAEEEIRACLVDTDKDVRNRAKEVLRHLDIDLSDVMKMADRWWEKQKLSLLDVLLLETRAGKGADLFLISGLPPQVRVGGSIAELNPHVLSDDDILQMVTAVISPDQERHFREERDLDFGYEILGEGRFRGNLFRQAGGTTAVFRLIPDQVPKMEELGLPQLAHDLIRLRQGLVLITGPASCGKSTTLAAMIERMNEERSDHIVTIEDPIEYVYRHKNCLVTQRELGRHAETFSDAIRSALREDPDIILVGEMRDLATISMAITAAETGHLVLATVHSLNAPKTVDRIIDVFPTGQQAQIRVMLSESLRGIISQQLLVRREGLGPVAAFETLLVNHAVANLIREDKVFQIPSTIATSRAQGMISMDQSLAELVRAGTVAAETAYLHAYDRDAFLELVDYRPEETA